jgi:hypothetical protein
VIEAISLAEHPREEQPEFRFFVFKRHASLLPLGARRLEAGYRPAHLSYVNKLLRHIPGRSAVIRFANGERITITIAPSGIIIAKIFLRVLRRRLLHWPRTDAKRLDQALIFFLSGPASDLPGDTVLELMASRFMRECQSIRDVRRLCKTIR